MFLDEFQEVSDCINEGSYTIPEKNDKGEYVDSDDFEHLYAEEDEDAVQPSKKAKHNI